MALTDLLNDIERQLRKSEAVRSAGTK